LRRGCVVETPQGRAAAPSNGRRIAVATAVARVAYFPERSKRREPREKNRGGKAKKRASGAPKIANMLQIK